MTQMNDLPQLPALLGSTSSRALVVGEPAARWEMRKLKPKHKQIAALLVTGLSMRDTAAACGCTPQLITILMKQALFKEYLQGLQAQLDRDMELMQGKAIRVIDEALEQNHDIKDRLKAADMLFKANGKYEKKVPETATAEDIVKKLLNVNIQVNVGSGGPAPLNSIEEV